MDADRPRAFVVGIVLLALSSLASIAFAFVPVDQGPPAFIIWLGVVLGILGVVAAVMLWQQRRWVLWLAVVVLVLGIVTTAPGLFLPPDLGTRIGALVWIIVSALSLGLLLLPRSREALTA